MTISELIREKTLSLRDSLSELEREYERAVAQRDAAENRVRRVSTDITRHRAIEGERKKSASQAREKVIEAQRVLDEIDRRRQQAIETLMKHQEECGAIEESLREAQASTETALSDIRKEQKESQEAETRIAKLRQKRGQEQQLCVLQMRQCLDEFLGMQSRHLFAAFESQEKRAADLREYEEFKKARHADPEISRLSEQREELQAFLKTAVVPGVKDMLCKSLQSVEDELCKRFPAALMPPPPASESQIDELLFYCSEEGKAVFLLPITSPCWKAAEVDDTAQDTTKAMSLVWHFLAELKLKRGEGDFDTIQGWPIFRSQFDLEDVAILQGFSVKAGELTVMHYALTRVPTELEEVLANEG